MHLHLPKPLHGWREFAGEVGIIVLGVLIALAADALIERTNWLHKVKLADANMRVEIERNRTNAAQYAILQPCAGRMLDRMLSIRLRKRKASGRGSGKGIRLSRRP